MKKQTSKKEDFNKKEIDKVLSECHDGEDCKVLMKDGTVKIVVKELLDKTK